MMILYGTTTNFAVSYDSLFTGVSAQLGPTLAQSVLDNCEYDLVRLSMLFGNILPAPASLPIQINLVSGAGGASNNNVNVINCYCGVNTDPSGLPSLVVAEEAEMFMTLQGKGWNPGWSNGEALSRVMGGLLYPERAWLFSVGSSWLNGDASSPNAARSDFVDNVWPTDQDFVSIACGTLFLNYLASQLNFTWPAIIGAGAPTTHTLAETATLLGVANPWTDFSNLIAAYLPPGANLPAEPTSFGNPPEPTDDPYPLGPLPTQVPTLYIRHNLADDGTSHTGSLSDSPDIILKNAPVANPQATYSTPASIASDTESDPSVLTGQANTVYTRVWNRGADAANVFASVYWSPPSTLVSPNLWTLIGTAYYPDVPPGGSVEVSNPGIVWPADKLPGPGHYCFVAAVGDADDPGPNPASFATFDDFANYIYANNNMTWRNFNVGVPGLQGFRPPFGEYVALPFQITGAWDGPYRFGFEAEADLPAGAKVALQTPLWLGKALSRGSSAFEEVDDPLTDPKEPRQMRLTLRPSGTEPLGEVELPAGTAAASQLMIHIPAARHIRPHKILIRQTYRKREVGRVTWLIPPPRSA
jgi:hypothetical protein